MGMMLVWQRGGVTLRLPSGCHVGCGGLLRVIAPRHVRQAWFPATCLPLTFLLLDSQVSCNDRHAKTHIVLAASPRQPSLLSKHDNASSCRKLSVDRKAVTENINLM
jgi:hypothetical protein